MFRHHIWSRLLCYVPRIDTYFEVLINIDTYWGGAAIIRTRDGPKNHASSLCSDTVFGPDYYAMIPRSSASTRKREKTTYVPPQGRNCQNREISERTKNMFCFSIPPHCLGLEKTKWRIISLCFEYNIPPCTRHLLTARNRNVDPVRIPHLAILAFHTKISIMSPEFRTFL